MSFQENNAGLLYEKPYHVTNISVDTYRAILNFFKRDSLTLVDTGVNGVTILCRHIPERDLDNDRRVVANAEFKE